MTVQEFFSADYLFNPSTPRESRLYIPLIILFGLLLVFCILIKIVRNLKFKKLADRYFTSFLTIGILGFIYLFCRYEQLPWLGTRFFLLLILSVLFVWTVINLIWALRYIPKYKKEINISERYNKYLPKKKTGRSR